MSRRTPIPLGTLQTPYEKKLHVALRMLAAGLPLVLLRGKAPSTKPTANVTAADVRNWLHGYDPDREHHNVGVILPADVRFVDYQNDPPAVLDVDASDLWTKTPFGGTHVFRLGQRTGNESWLAPLPESTTERGTYAGSPAWDIPGDPFDRLRIRETRISREGAVLRTHAPELTGPAPAPFWIVLAENHEFRFPDQPYNFARFPTEIDANDCASKLALSAPGETFHVLRRSASLSLRKT